MEILSLGSRCRCGLARSIFGSAPTDPDLFARPVWDLVQLGEDFGGGFIAKDPRHGCFKKDRGLSQTLIDICDPYLTSKMSSTEQGTSMIRILEQGKFGDEQRYNLTAIIPKPKTVKFQK